MTLTTSVAPSDRLTSLPEYPFGLIDALKLKLINEGKELVDLSLGSPDTKTHPEVVKALESGMQKLRNQQYPIFNGQPEFKKSIADWMKHRFNVTVDADNGVLPLLGTKEGIAHLAFAYIKEGDYTISPSPYYPVHVRGTLLAGGSVYEMPLTPENQFRADLDAIPEEILEKAKILVLNYPHNPTGAVVDKAYLQKAVNLCRDHGLILLNDFAYSEIWFDDNKPCSALEVDGGMDVTVEFQTFSKTYNMAGFRLGFAVGNPEYVQTLYKLKNSVDYGVCMGVQEAGTAALNLGDEYRTNLRLEYQARRDLVVSELKKMGWNNLITPGGAMYVWAPIPEGFKDCNEFTAKLIENAGVSVVPGTTFGPQGEGFFRIALVQPQDQIQKAMDKMASYLK